MNAAQNGHTHNGKQNHCFLVCREKRAEEEKEEIQQALLERVLNGRGFGLAFHESIRPSMRLK